jgi:hypothetical protein
MWRRKRVRATQKGHRITEGKRYGRARLGGNGIGGELSRADGDEAEDLTAVDGHMGRSGVVAELALAGIRLEETVQLDVAAGEAGSIVGTRQRPREIRGRKM